MPILGFAFTGFLESTLCLRGAMRAPPRRQEIPTNRTLLVTLALVLLTPLAAMADPGNPGIPDTTCQTPAEWRLHDYGPAVTGVAAILPLDGNLGPCPSSSTWLDPASLECALLGSEPETTRAYQALCVNDRQIESDGDKEFALGGALLVSATGDGVTSGGVACHGITGHHPQGGLVTVTDALSDNVLFAVTADSTNPASPVPPGQTDCGDGIVQPCDDTPPAPSGAPLPVNVVLDTVNGLLYSLLNDPSLTCTPGDRSKLCVSSCLAAFPPGADGAYVVVVGLSVAPDAYVTPANHGHIHL